MAGDAPYRAIFPHCLSRTQVRSTLATSRAHREAGSSGQQTLQKIEVCI